MTIIITPAYLPSTDADAYFSARFPSTIWSLATTSDKTAALITASDAIDRLNFAGQMTSINFKLLMNGAQLTGVTTLVVKGTGKVPDAGLFQLDGNTYPIVSHTETGSNTTGITIAAPGLLVGSVDNDPVTVYQVRQFPRGTDVVVPQDILKATCELAYAFLDDVDPSIEKENVNTLSQGLGDARTSYTRDFGQPHILAGIPSIQAWHLLLPYLRDPNEIRMLRDSYRLGNPQSFI